ncbi:MAG: thiol:disulfide interchange protein DsbA/DsbL [Gammaproteobacteria bacterium]|nr:thiol:disulfide interchange protein DsbA/DsbL [Gammaproteobacteria bacterium]
MRKLTKILVATAMLAGMQIGLHAEEFEEGVHYERIDPPQPTTTGDKVEVREMFWYGCPHCFRMEPYVERWLRKQPKGSEFVRTPAIFRPGWENHARAYYTAELLGVVDKIQQPLFNAIHLEKRHLDTDEQLRDFFAEHGVDKIEFTKTFRSFAVETYVRRSKALAGRYGINGVPAFIVNGKYRVSNRNTGGNANTINVINYLVEKESKK